MKKKIIVAPLNWGLGHAARCVPIINSLITNNFTPIIASDGKALAFLQKEFPNLETLELPSYNISYGRNLKLNLFLKSFSIWKKIQKEQKVISQFIAENKDVVGIISDNRFGVRSVTIPSVYITHQVNVFSGFTSFLTSKIHQKIINKFDECWIPDTKEFTFSGKLSEGKKLKVPYKFIGVLSRFKQEKKAKRQDLLVLISGVEPNRTSFEKKLKKELKNYSGSIILVQGKIEPQQKIFIEENIKIYNFMLSNELEKTINASEIIICRSGYSSIMDLAILEKKVFFIPTKNQTEQEYLARFLEAKKVAPYSSEENFSVEKLLEVHKYSGLMATETKIDDTLFSLFHSKRKLWAFSKCTFKQYGFVVSFNNMFNNRQS